MIFWDFSSKLRMPKPEDSLPGRNDRMPVPARHFVLGSSLLPPFPDGMETALFGLGCFWGAERKFWEASGVFSTSVGYAWWLHPQPHLPGGVQRPDAVTTKWSWWSSIPRGRAMEKCSESSGKTTIRPRVCARATTWGPSTAQESTPVPIVRMTWPWPRWDPFQQELTAAEYGRVTTEVLPAPDYFYAEDYHQQYLAKNPAGYCGLGGTGVRCPEAVERV